mmetsp:Transcript_4446/g.12824  ORF Transcript_4446/g.12824 Transcript_4446/m.12824 type:complete len:278 (-) Transcript_4446:46-879(-)
MHRMDSTTPRGPWAVSTFLRALLRVLNLVLAFCGLAILGYSIYIFGEWNRDGAIKSTTPWFIFVVGGAGLFTFLTAAAGLIGAARNSHAWLAVYAFMAVVLLLAQVGVALLLLLDKSWQKKLPHDNTGEAAKMEKWIKARMHVCRWVGLAVLITQIVSVLVAFALNKTQQELIRGYSDDDEEVWGRHRPLLAEQTQPRGSAAGSSVGGDVEVGVTTPNREDPWSQRMRDKYGLDTEQFSHVAASPVVHTPPAAAPPLAAHAEPPPAADSSGGRCGIM